MSTLSLLRLPGIKMGGSRFLHVGQILAAVDKSNLAKLRKRTGFSISNCKKALDMHANDIAKAEEWLQAEAQAQGWAKASKLSGRTTAQGLVGVHIDGPVGAILEVNCETDFVARNEQFRSLVSQAAKECAVNTSSLRQDTLLKGVCQCTSSSCQIQSGISTIHVEFMSEEQLKGMVASDGKTLADHLALVIGVIGENMSLPRAARLVAPDGVQLVGYSHPTPSDETKLLGKFGAILALRSPGALTEVARQLCLHVIGMNPKAIGNPDDPKAPNSDDEMLLIHQEFLTDPTKTVGEVLQEENIEVVDYIRFECGENNKEE
ncbi:elongation factor Ts, mitochondrial isoform X2 [Palaemon carinicauda]|uniref:elongation factor Ts, mitochondrial isoform X2 n=1 Tax=Palaemon carinicauda TaxID=392227 RepID=UPI0035B6377A